VVAARRGHQRRVDPAEEDVEILGEHVGQRISRRGLARATRLHGEVGIHGPILPSTRRIAG
jgi:hypothetical protein